MDKGGAEWVNLRCNPTSQLKEPAMMSLLELFVSVDDFCQVFLPFWERKLLADGKKKRRRTGQLRVSEITPALAAQAQV